MKITGNRLKTRTMECSGDVQLKKNYLQEKDNTFSSQVHTAQTTQPQGLDSLVAYSWVCVLDAWQNLPHNAYRT